MPIDSSAPLLVVILWEKLFECCFLLLANIYGWQEKNILNTEMNVFLTSGFDLYFTSVITHVFRLN